MGNSPSQERQRRKPRSEAADISWVIPLNRGKIPTLRTTQRAPRRSAPRALYRKPSLRTVAEANNNNSMPSWAEFRDYLLHGPQLPARKNKFRP